MGQRSVYLNSYIQSFIVEYSCTAGPRRASFTKFTLAAGAADLLTSCRINSCIAGNRIVQHSSCNRSFAGTLTFIPSSGAINPHLVAFPIYTINFLISSTINQTLAFESSKHNGNYSTRREIPHHWWQTTGFGFAYWYSINDLLCVGLLHARIINYFWLYYYLINVVMDTVRAEWL